MEILSKYDGDSLSKKDAQAIFEEIRKADIHPGPGFTETIEEAGFDLEQFKLAPLAASTKINKIRYFMFNPCKLCRRFCNSFICQICLQRMRKACSHKSSKPA